jgi:hypothetical protein
MRSLDCGVVERHACFALFLREFDDQDAILGGERDQHHESDLTIEVEIEAGELDAGIGAEDRDDDGLTVLSYSATRNR